jgi:hypothetical protein
MEIETRITLHLPTCMPVLDLHQHKRVMVGFLFTFSLLFEQSKATNGKTDAEESRHVSLCIRTLHNMASLL